MEVVQFCQEPFVDFGHTPYTLNRITGPEGRGYCENALVGRTLQFLVDVAREIILNSCLQHFDIPRGNQRLLPRQNR